jgi:two-component system, NtrC family, sensor kinase
LVAGIAHEVNSPLGAMISGASTVSQVKAKLEGEVKPLLPEPKLERSLAVLGDAAKAIVDGGRRIGDLVTALRSFSHHEHADKTRIDLREGLESALKMVPETTRPKIEIARDYQEVHAECEPRALNQVFLTLFLNACEAMKGEGRLSIALRSDGAQAIIEIADTGPGIPSDRLASLFELAFSAKRRVGMGLGLPTARHVMARHGGRIEVESPPGGGARFRLSLPIR